MKSKKLLALLLAVAMTTAAFAGCSGGGASSSTPAAPSGSASEPAKGGMIQASGPVKMLVSVTGGKDENEMKKFAEAMSTKTGLEVSMEKPADYNQTLLQKLQSGEKLDLVYLNINQYMSLIEQGALTDLTDFMKSSPVFSDPNVVDPQELIDITVDGKIYAGFNKKEVHRTVALNKVHLAKAGIADYKGIDPTLDGYYNTFKALKASNPDKEYFPLDAVMSTVWDLQPWMASAGLSGGLVADTDGNLIVPWSTDAAAPVWEWLHKLYAEGLLDPAAMVDKSGDMRNKMGAASQKVSCVVDWAAWVGLYNANAIAGGVASADYEVVPAPGIKGPKGYMLAKGNASLFGIPSNAANPDGAKKLLEFFATQEGGELLSVGVPEIDYTIGGDGKWALTELGAKHSNDHGAPVPIFKGFKHPIGYNPGVEEALGYGEYASIQMPMANQSDYEEVMGKWAVAMIKGDSTVTDGLAKMREELLARKVTQK